VESFNYKIREFYFADPRKVSKILNLNIDDEYNYNSDNLLAPRIKISNIVGNYVSFTLDIYYNTNNNWYLSNSALSTNKELLFGTYEYIIYSDNFTQTLTADTVSDSNFITFYNGSITITSNMIYSYNSELSNNFYDPRIFTDTDLSNSDLSNIMFLSINNSNNSNNTNNTNTNNTNNQSLCGLTKKNLYNNIFFDEN
jgi:hypothetical protein